MDNKIKVSTRVEAKLAPLFLVGFLIYVYIPIFVDIFKKYQQKLSLTDFVSTVFLGLLFLSAIKAMQSFFVQKIEFDFRSGKIALYKTFNKIVVYKTDIQEWGIRSVGGYPGHVLGKFFECKFNNGKVIYYPLFYMNDYQKITDHFKKISGLAPKEYNPIYGWLKNNDFTLFKYLFIFILL